MDSLIAAAARALAVGDTLGALNRVSLREDPPALALRGIAMAQLGELARARQLLRRAVHAFGAHEAVGRARCVVANAEVCLAMRDLEGSTRSLDAAAGALDAHGDRANALHARLVTVRRLLLTGRLDLASRALHELDLQGVPAALLAVAEMAAAELALRFVDTAGAANALEQARIAAEQADVPALRQEVAELGAALDRPAARLLHKGKERALRLDEVESLLASGALVVDACRRGLRVAGRSLPLKRRPVLFELACALAEVWPEDLPRDALIERAFRLRQPDETHRARLRVEIGRLRALARPFAAIEASSRGYAWKPCSEAQVCVLLPPIDGEQASLLALLADGTPWSTSALAIALGASQRTVQRSLVELEATGRARSIGRARAQRWLAPPLAGFTTILLLPTTMPPA